MELRALKLFCDLVETRSFSRAAERNFVSQSAVSQQIRTLEREYEQELVERGKGKGLVVPTEAGKLLYDGAKVLLRQATELEDSLRSLTDEVSGTVRVSTVYSVGLHALPQRLKPFLATHPRVRVHLEYSQTGKIYQDVLSGAIDVGIVAVPSPRSGIEVIPFGEQQMVLICAPEHPLADCGVIHLRSLEGQAFIAFDEAIPTRRLIDEQLRKYGVRVNIVSALDNIETIKNLVEIGSGVALVPGGTVKQEVREGSLKAISLEKEEAFQRPEGILVKRSGTRRAVVRSFIAAMSPEDYQSSSSAAKTGPSRQARTSRKPEDDSGQ